MAADQKKLPVYIFNNGVTVVPCYGAGLWGPIWGYIGIKDDLTITKACFGHKGETPGLGAKITDMPEVFADKFTGKTITAEILVAKNVTGENDVNAISGATITSTAAGVMVNQWLGFYKGYFGEAQPCCAETEQCCTDACCNEAAEVAAEEVAVESNN
jgi:Na+-transporting NADH:ubiquinone oxidoreductase subunit C